MMRYESVSKLTEGEILGMLNGSPSDEDVIRAVMASIYYHDTKFAGETLFRCLQSSSGDLRLGLMRMVHTFMQTHRTAYLAESFLTEMNSEDKVSVENLPELIDLLEGVVEFEEMFRGRPPMSGASV